MEEPFVQKFENFGKWDPAKVIADLRMLIESAGANWNLWHDKAVFNLPGYEEYKDNGDINLTSNVHLCENLPERLLRHSGRIYKEKREINDGDLCYILPELEGTYTGNMLKEFQKKLGPIRVRLHNRATRYGLYWHRDGHAKLRYHLVLWTNPGHFLVWTDKPLQYEPGFSKEDCLEEFDIQGKFIPANGHIYGLTTQKTHAVCSIAVGYKQIDIVSRCHLTFWPVKPNNRY